EGHFKHEKWRAPAGVDLAVESRGDIEAIEAGAVAHVKELEGLRDVDGDLLGAEAGSVGAHVDGALFFDKEALLQTGDRAGCVFERRLQGGKEDFNGGAGAAIAAGQA